MQRVGPDVFGNPSAELDPTSNRELLVEICREHSLFVANTCTEIPLGKLVTYFGLITYFGLSSSPSSLIRFEHFAQIDHILLPQVWSSTVVRVFTDRDPVLQNHHFIMIVDLCVAATKKTPNKKWKVDGHALQNLCTRKEFVNVFAEKLL